MILRPFWGQDAACSPLYPKSIWFRFYVQVSRTFERIGSAVVRVNAWRGAFACQLEKRWQRNVTCDIDVKYILSISISLSFPLPFPSLLARTAHAV